MEDINAKNYQNYQRLYASNTLYSKLLEKSIELKQLQLDNAPYAQINRTRSAIAYYTNIKKLDRNVTNLSLDELRSIQEALDQDKKEILNLDKPSVKKKINNYLRLISKERKYLKFLKRCIEFKKCSTAKDKNKTQTGLKYYIKLGLDKNLMNLTLVELNFLQSKVDENKTKL